MREVARWAAQCALFPDVAGNEAYALAKIAFGQEIGFGPIASLVNVFFRDGLPALRAAAIAARIAAHPDYDYRIVSLDEAGCTLEFSHLGKPVGTCTYYADDARRAEPVISRFWQQHPKSMFFARALGIGARRYCAPVFGGALYATAELPGCDDGIHDRLPAPLSTPPKEPDATRAALIETILTRYAGDLAKARAGYAAFMRAPAALNFDDALVEDLQAYAHMLEPAHQVA